jgi:hypothetical protein
VLGETIILDVVAPVDQLYVPPLCDGEAVIVAEEPAQIVGLLVVSVGMGLTVTVPEDVVGEQVPKE